MSPVSTVLHTEATVIFWVQERIQTLLQIEVYDPYLEHNGEQT